MILFTRTFKKLRRRIKSLKSVIIALAHKRRNAELWLKCFHTTIVVGGGGVDNAFSNHRFYKHNTSSPERTCNKVLVAKLDFRHSLYKERKFTGVACLPTSLVSECNAWIFILCCVRYWTAIFYCFQSLIFRLNTATFKRKLILIFMHPHQRRFLGKNGCMF